MVTMKGQRSNVKLIQKKYFNCFVYWTSQSSEMPCVQVSNNCFERGGRIHKFLTPATMVRSKSNLGCESVKTYSNSYCCISVTRCTFFSQHHFDNLLLLTCHHTNFGQDSMFAIDWFEFPLKNILKL